MRTLFVAVTSFVLGAASAVALTSRRLKRHIEEEDYRARLQEALDECQRTGKPVKVEFAGHETTLWVSPPRGTERN